MPSRRWSRKYAKLEQKLAAVQQVEKEEAECCLAKRLAGARKVLDGVAQVKAKERSYSFR